MEQHDPAENPHQQHGPTVLAARDERLTNYIRFFSLCLSGVCTVILVSLVTKWDQMGDSLERFDLTITAIDKRVTNVEKTSDMNTDNVRKVIIDQRVQEELYKNSIWRLNRIERRLGLFP
jgi:hypothetical protein